MRLSLRFLAWAQVLKRMPCGDTPHWHEVAFLKNLLSTTVLEDELSLPEQIKALVHAHGCFFVLCSVPHCSRMKLALRHMTNCRDGNECRVPYCNSYRLLMNHWEKCKKESCCLCGNAEKFTELKSDFTDLLGKLIGSGVLMSLRNGRAPCQPTMQSQTALSVPTVAAIHNKLPKKSPKYVINAGEFSVEKPKAAISNRLLRESITCESAVAGPSKNEGCLKRQNAASNPRQSTCAPPHSEGSRISSDGSGGHVVPPLCQTSKTEDVNTLNERIEKAECLADQDVETSKEAVKGNQPKGDDDALDEEETYVSFSLLGSAQEALDDDYIFEEIPPTYAEANALSECDDEWVIIGPCTERVGRLSIG